MGAIERKVLAAVEEAGSTAEPLVSAIVHNARSEAGLLDPWRLNLAERSSVRRALASLARKGMIFRAGRRYHLGRESPALETYMSRSTALPCVDRLETSFGDQALRDYPDLIRLAALR